MRARCWALRSAVSSEAGSSVVTVLLLFPVLVAFTELIVLGGRVATTHADVQSAAREAARQASVASGPGSAADVIDDAVDDALADKGFSCQSPSAEIGGATDYVQGGQVEVVVTCTVALSDLDLLSLPGEIEITRAAVEPIERYRVIE